MDADLEKRARELLAQHEQHDKTGGAPVVRRDDAIRAIAAALSAGQADARRYRWLRERWGRLAEEYEGDELTFIGREKNDGEGWYTAPDSVDAAIDAALSRAANGTQAGGGGE